MSDRYAVIGNPISHTKSPVLHAAFAHQCHQDMSYEAIFGPIGEFRETVEAFRRAGGRGMNVTVPFKVEALVLADKLTTRARLAQAVNTLRFDDDGIFGDNTDGIGLVHDIQGRLGFGVEGKRIPWTRTRSRPWRGWRGSTGFRAAAGRTAPGLSDHRQPHVGKG